jgi:cation diffusion facilitator family transporter
VVDENASAAAASRDLEVRRVLAVVLVLNLAVALAKLIVGWLSGAISMVADGFHSLTDSASNVVGLIALSVARRPPDEDHPYGHRKFETLAALIIGGLLALTAWEVLQSCIQRLREGGAPEAGLLGFAVMGVTIVVNLVVSTWERKEGRRLQSELLHADSEHTRADVFTSLAVIASLVAVRLGYPQIDVLAAVVITLVIARAAFSILRENGMLLTDTALLPAARVRSEALQVSGVVSVHKIRSRGGLRGGHADLHVQVDPDLLLEEAHLIGHRVADRLRRELDLGDVLVHVEPATERTHSSDSEARG